MLTFNSYAQNFCLTPETIANREALIEPYRNLDYTNYSFCVTIYVHVIRQSNGEGGQSPTDVDEALDKLADAYTPYQIFFDWDNNIDYIDNDTYFENPQGGIWNENKHTDGVDIYLFDDNASRFDGELLGAGAANQEENRSEFYTFGHFFDANGDELPTARSYVIAHEMGHVLYLWHTHHGTGETNQEIDPLECPEYPNGSNSSSCGDYITDTPADPNMALNVDLQTCEWLGAANSPYDPDEFNIMSYSQATCLEYLTFQQSRRMKNAMASLSYLQDLSNYSTAVNPCAPPPTPLNYFPNNANQELNLDLTDKPVANYSYVLYDSTGIVVASGESQNVLETIDTSTLLEGTYFLHFYENGLLTIKQIVVDH